MAALDFPASPATGDRYPTPAVAGTPQYSWDGEKWTTASGSTTTAPPATATPLEDNATPQVGVTTKYAREDHVHPSTALKYSAQTLSEAQAAQSRKNIYAAPMDALAYSGMQINGSMEVSQELGAAGVTINGKYALDGWRLHLVGTMAVTAAQGVGAVFSGFPFHLALSVQTAQVSLGAGDYTTLMQPIEGYRIARLAWGTANAQPITIGFWTRHTRTGVYSGTIRNSAGNRCYAFTYTQNAVTTAQYNVVTIPGCTDGVWAVDNTIGLSITLAVGVGSTNIAPSANTWLTGSYLAAPGQINGVAATSDIFRTSGLVVLPGIEAPSAERSPLIMRPYDQELLTCQRYWQRLDGTFISGYGTAGAVIYQPVFLSPTMRAEPTLAFTGPTYANASAYSVAVVGGGYVRAQAIVTGTAQAWAQANITANARL